MFRASASEASFTIEPRPKFAKTACLGNSANRAASNIPRVANVSGAQRTSGAQRRPPSLVASPARKDDGDGGNVLSDVDARVLRSILEDEKLDVSTEGGVKRLLEKGTRVPPPSERKPLIENEEGEYASTVLKVRMATPGGTGRLESHVFFGGGRVSADAAVSAVSTAVAIARSVLITHPTPSFIITYFWFTQSRARRPSPIPSYGTP